MKRYDVLSVSEYTKKDSGEVKTQWTKCGVMFEGKTEGFSLMLEMLPLNQPSGQPLRFVIREPKPFDENSAPAERRPPAKINSEDIPF